MEHHGLALAACFGAITSMCAIMCCFGRTVPHNYFLLCIFTACEGYMVAGLTARYPREIVVLAGLSTALVTVALTIYALVTKTDISVFSGLAFVLYLAMIPIMIIGMFIHTKMLHILYCCLGLMFYSIYLIMDTMQICRSDKFVNGYEFSYDDYIIAAMQLYIDIIMIFVYILQLLGSSRD